MPVVGDVIDSEVRQKLETIKQKKESIKMRGVVKFYNVKRGWGFITSKTGEEYFVHWSGISGRGFRVLRDGEEVSFEFDHDPKGRPRAVNVQVLQAVTADPVDDECEPKTTNKEAV